MIDLSADRHEEIVLLDLIAFFHLYLIDHAQKRRIDDVLDLQRFDYENLVVRLDLDASLDEHGHDGSGKRCSYSFRHGLSLFGLR
jgi:hypothetical protein